MPSRCSIRSGVGWLGCALFFRQSLLPSSGARLVQCLVRFAKYFVQEYLRRRSFCVCACRAFRQVKGESGCAVSHSPEVGRLLLWTGA